MLDTQSGPLPLLLLGESQEPLSYPKMGKRLEISSELWACGNTGSWLQPTNQMSRHQCTSPHPPGLHSKVCLCALMLAGHQMGPVKMWASVSRCGWPPYGTEARCWGKLSLANGQGMGDALTSGHCPAAILACTGLAFTCGQSSGCSSEVTAWEHLNPTQDLHPHTHIPEPSLLGTESLIGGTLPCVPGKAKDGVVAAKLESAKEEDGVESCEKEQEQRDGGKEGGGGGDNEALRAKQKRKMSKSKYIVTLTFCCI